MWMLFKGPQRSSRWLEPEKSAWLLTTTSFRRLDHRRIQTETFRPLTFPVAIRHRRTGSSRLAATSTRAFHPVLLFT